MGYIATPTPDMGDFHVETRSHSVKVYGPERRDSIYALHLMPGDDGKVGGIEISNDAIDALIAALQQAQRIRDRGQKYEWAADVGDGRLVPVEATSPTAEVAVGAEMLVAALAEGDAETANLLRRIATPATHRVSELTWVAEQLDARRQQGDAVAAVADHIAAAVAAGREQWAQTARAALNLDS